jgi:hypothetical protein
MSLGRISETDLEQAALSLLARSGFAVAHGGVPIDLVGTLRPW